MVKEKINEKNNPDDIDPTDVIIEIINKYKRECDLESIINALLNHWYDDDILDCFDNDDIIDHLRFSSELQDYLDEERPINEEPECIYDKKQVDTKDFNDFKNGELKRFLCNLFGFNYHIDNNTLINFIKDKINS